MLLFLFQTKLLTWSQRLAPKGDLFDLMLNGLLVLLSRLNLNVTFASLICPVLSACLFFVALFQHTVFTLLCLFSQFFYIFICIQWQSCMTVSFHLLT